MIRENVTRTDNEAEGRDLRVNGRHHPGHLQWLPGQAQSFDSNAVPWINLSALLGRSADARLCSGGHLPQGHEVSDEEKERMSNSIFVFICSNLVLCSSFVSSHSNDTVSVNWSL